VRRAEKEGEAERGTRDPCDPYEKIDDDDFAEFAVRVNASDQARKSKEQTPCDEHGRDAAPWDRRLPNNLVAWLSFPRNTRRVVRVKVHPDILQ
jgi:hypothetical protein